MTKPELMYEIARSLGGVPLAQNLSAGGQIDSSTPALETAILGHVVQAVTETASVTEAWRVLSMRLYEDMDTLDTMAGTAYNAWLQHITKNEE